MTFLSKSLTAIALGISFTANAMTQIDLYTWRSQEKGLWDEINRQGLIENVKVAVKVLKYESYADHVILNLQNNTPDLFQWAPGASSLQPLITHQFIAPFNGSLDQINKSALLASLGPDEQLYGVPFALQMQSVLVHKKLLNQHNIKQQPQSLTELENIFDKLKSKGITPIHLAGNENWYLNQLVAEVLLAGLVNEKFAQKLVNGEACFTDSEYQQTLDILTRWQQKGYLNSNASSENYGGMANSVALGNSAMAIDGGWRTNPSSTFFKVDPDFQFYFWPIPGNSNKVYALGDGSYQVNKNSIKAEAADRALAFTATKQFAELFAKHVNELPAYGGSFYIENPLLKEMSKKVSNAYTVSLFNAYSLNKGNPSYRSLVVDGLKALLSGERSAKLITQDIQTGLNSWGYVGSRNCQ